MKAGSLIRFFTGTLLILNFLLLYLFLPEVHRWGRIACSAVFLLYLAKDISPRHTPFIGSVACFFIADIFALWYDQIFPQQIYFALHSLAYLIMLFQVKHFIRKPSGSGFERFFFLAVFLIHVTFMFIIGDILSEEVDNLLLEMLFYVYGISAVGLITVGVLFYNHFSDKKAKAFLFTTLGLVFSNITGFSAHFLEYAEFFYVDRFLYVSGMASYIYFSHAKTTKSKKDFLGVATESENSRFHQGDVDLLENRKEHQHQFHISHL